MTARRILMLGAPGVGKGTQAAKLVKSLRVPHISTGDMLRAAVAAETPVGLKAKSIMDAGRLVGDDVVIAIAEERLRQPDASEGFVLDGFPRTLPQAEALDALLERLGTPLECCLVLSVDRESVIERLVKRAQVENRSDDDEETVRERMRVYEAQTEPLIEYYRGRDLIREVDGNGSVEEVFSRIEEELGA